MILWCRPFPSQSPLPPKNDFLLLTPPSLQARSFQHGSLSSPFDSRRLTGVPLIILVPNSQMFPFFCIPLPRKPPLVFFSSTLLSPPSNFRPPISTPLMIYRSLPTSLPRRFSPFLTGVSERGFFRAEGSVPAFPPSWKLSSHCRLYEWKGPTRSLATLLPL